MHPIPVAVVVQCQLVFLVSTQLHVLSVRMDSTYQEVLVFLALLVVKLVYQHRTALFVHLHRTFQVLVVFHVILCLLGVSLVAIVVIALVVEMAIFCQEVSVSLVRTALLLAHSVTILECVKVVSKDTSSMDHFNVPFARLLLSFLAVLYVTHLLLVNLVQVDII